MKKTLHNAAYALPLFLVACGGTATATSDGENAADSADTASLTASMSSLTTDGVDASVTTSSAAATSALTKAMTLLQPQGCATAKVDANIVTYTFNGCTGPYGLVSLSGTVVASYAMVSGGGGVTVTMLGANLQANGNSVSLNATSTVSGLGATRQAMVSSMTSAVTARGQRISHSGNYTAAWDGTCLTLNGAFSTQIGLLGWSTAITNYKRCQGMCPASGSVVITAGTSSATVTYSGSATAMYKDDKGNSGTVTLSCTK